MSLRRPSGGPLDNKGPALAALAASSVFVIDLATGRRFTGELWLGMCAPLAAVVATWPLIERTYRTGPERLTGLMIGAFAGKLVFFGAYVALVVAVAGLTPVPFALSFTGYFITLHLIEALWLKRLLISGQG